MAQNSKQKILKLCGGLEIVVSTTRGVWIHILRNGLWVASYRRSTMGVGDAVFINKNEVLKTTRTKGIITHQLGGD